MPRAAPKLETVVERAIRNSLTDIASLKPAERTALLKVATDFLKVQKLLSQGNFGSFFRENEDPDREAL
jgi:hypothetical protein